MKSKWMWALPATVVLLAAGVTGGKVLATPATGQMTTTLANATSGDLDLSGQALVTTVGNDGKPHPSGVWLAWIKTHGLSDLYVIDNKFAPGGTTGWHSHAGPSLIFVVNGSITNYASDDPTCSPHVYGKGSSFVDAGGDDVHMLRNEGTDTAETIAVQFIPQGVPRRTDAAEPSNCHI
ncbi:MAG TPA: cupin domain-containing protein [Gaiellaceae bacterium]|jgi:quercetin dioxygenase-like cupin family protein